MRDSVSAPCPYEIPDHFAETGRHAVRFDDSAPTMYQVLGERGSGTNVVRKAIDKNIDVFRTEGLGWKHAFPHMVAIPANLLTICVVRDARKWSLSMHDRPWHSDPALQSLGFSEFIRAPWRGIVDRPDNFQEIHPEMEVQGETLQFDRHPLTGLPFDNLFALRRCKLEGMLSMLNRGCNVALVRLERFIEDTQGTLDWLSESFELPMPKSPYKPVTRRLGVRHKYSVNDHPETPKSLTDDDLSFLRQELDVALEARLGYRY